MRQIKLLLLLANFFVVSFSYGTAFVKGVNENLAGNKLYLVPASNIQNYSCYTFATDSMVVEKDGNFQFSIQSNFGFYDLRNDKGRSILSPFHIYLQEKDSLEIVVENYKVWFEGNCAQRHQLQQNIYNLDYLFGKYSTRYEMNLAAFDTFVNNLKSKRQALLAAEQIPNTAPEYKEFLAAQIQLNWCANILEYTRLNSFYTTRTWKRVPIESFSFEFNPMHYVNEQFCFLNDYQNTIQGLIDYKFDSHVQKLGYDNFNSDSAVFVINGFIESTYTGVNLEIASMIYSKMLKLRIHDVDVFYSFIDQWETKWNDKSSKYIRLLSQNLEEIKKLKPGAPAPNITLPNLNGELINLSDFKGKVVYIDFWATWCGPCIEAIDDHIKLQDSLKGKDVVFIQVAMESGGKSIANWRKMVTEKYPNWGGIHLVAEGQMQNSQVQKYGVIFAPTYVLIDKEGKIVTPKSKSPNKVAEEILKLL